MTATTIRHKNALGCGIYTAPDIAQLLGLPRGKVNRYLKTYWDERMGRQIFNDSYSWQTENSPTKAVNFYVLIELYTFFQLQELGVPIKNILLARERIAKETASQYPFATSDILTDGKKILYQFKEAIINADGTRQTNFIEIIKNFAHKIDFDNKGNAENFYPNGRESVVVVNPHHQFGQPVIEGTNINAEMIFSMYQSGESIDLITHLYDLDIKAVNDAVRFYQKAA